MHHPRHNRIHHDAVAISFGAGEPVKSIATRWCRKDYLARPDPSNRCCLSQIFFWHVGLCIVWRGRTKRLQSNPSNRLLLDSASFGWSHVHKIIFELRCRSPWLMAAEFCLGICSTTIVDYLICLMMFRFIILWLHDSLSRSIIYLTSREIDSWHRLFILFQNLLSFMHAFFYAF